MALKVVPTKGNLIAMKKSLQLANLGYNLMDQKRNVLIKEMMTLLDDVKLIRDQITSSYQEAYDALQEANISMGLITDIVNSTPEDYGISIAYRSVMGVEIPKIAYDKQPLKMTYDTIRKTQKRANALRNISIPRFESTIKVISEALEEKEREEFTRQKVIKEMKK